MRSTYRNVLSRRDVLSALVPYLLGRLPLSMAPLAVLLLVRAETGSYNRAGLATAAYVLGVAVAGPVLGRQVDRRGQGPVLLLCGLLHPAAMISVAAAASAHQYALVIVTAVFGGVTLPPVSACMRVLWSRLLTDDSSRRAGFAIEGVIVEAAELTGPLLVSIALLLSKPATAVIVSGTLTGAAALLFRVSSASREVPASTNAQRWGALALPGVRRLLVVVGTSTASIGAVEVAITAYARTHGGPSSTGLYIALISVGGIVGGLMFGGAGRFTDRRGPMSLAGMLALSALTAAALASSMRLAYAIVALFVFGATVACGVIVQLAMMAAVSTEDVRTEAFTWGGTANFLGLGVGTALAGWVVDASSLHRAFLVAGIPALLAAGVVVLSRRELSGTVTLPASVVPVSESAAPEVAVSAVQAPAAHVVVTPAVALDEPVAVPAEPVALPADLVAAADEPALDNPDAITPEPAVTREPIVVVRITELDGELAEPTPTDVGRPVVAAVPELDPALLELEEMREHVSHLEVALEAALADAAGAQAIADAHQRARRMLERADAACLEMRQRAEDDAARVRNAATEAALAVLSAAERDARAMLDRARREAETIANRARQVAIPAQPDRPALHALPDVDEMTDLRHETL